MRRVDEIVRKVDDISEPWPHSQAPRPPWHNPNPLHVFHEEMALDSGYESIFHTTPKKHTTAMLDASESREFWPQSSSDSQHIHQQSQSPHSGRHSRNSSYNNVLDDPILSHSTATPTANPHPRPGRLEGRGGAYFARFEANVGAILHSDPLGANEEAPPTPEALLFSHRPLSPEPKVSHVME